MFQALIDSVPESEVKFDMTAEISFEDVSLLDVSLNLEIDENNNYETSTRPTANIESC